MEHLSTNSFLETEKISKLMKKYAVPCITSLLVAAMAAIQNMVVKLRSSCRTNCSGHCRMLFTLLSMVREVLFGVGIP